MNKEDRILYIDADTVLYSSAAQEQKLKCLAKHLPTGRDKLFDSKTEFNQWLKENPRWDIKDFEFEVVAELYGQAEFAFRNINRKIDSIVRASGCKEYFVCIQGTGNFRNEYESEYVDYKAHRAAKPILYPQCFEFVQRKFKDRCIVTSGIETDDFVCQKGWESYVASGGDPEKAKHVIAFVDKDIPANTPGLLLNYNKLEEGVFWNSRTDQVKKFLSQVLTGDKADAIPGIKQLGPETKKKYKITHKGCGPVAAEKILDCTFEVEMARNVVEAYKEAWPDDWLQRMTDSCFFLYLQQYDGDQFDVHKLFNGMGVYL